MLELQTEDEYALCEKDCRSMESHRKANDKHKSALAGILFGLFILVVYVMIRTGQEAHEIKELKVAVTSLTTTYNGTRELSTHHNDKRFIWFVGMALWTVNTAFSLYGLTVSCQHFSESTDSAVLCVYGAISTACTLGALAYDATVGAIGVWRFASSIIQLASRDLHHSDHVWAQISANTTEKYGFPMNLHGFIHKNNTKHGHMVQDGHESWPVFEFTNHHGHKMHQIAKLKPDGTVLARIGLAANKAKRQDYYDDEYFTSGGLDFTSCSGGDTVDELNTGDWANMESQVQIVAPDLTAASGLEYQLYDQDEEETIGGGSVSAVDPDGNSNIDDMPECPNSMPALDSTTFSSSGKRLRRRRVLRV